MPKGPNGQKRPADGVGMSVMVAKIATGEIEDTSYVSQNRRKSGVAGAKARMEATTREDRQATARAAADTRWKKRSKAMTGTCQVALEQTLFGTEGRKLVNFKMLRGDAPLASKEELCDVIHSGITQRLAGLAESHTNFPEAVGAESIDLTRLK